MSATIIIDGRSNLHPYECGGRCEHCDKRKVWTSRLRPRIGRIKPPTPNDVTEWVLSHDPNTCDLCSEESNG